MSPLAGLLAAVLLLLCALPLCAQGVSGTVSISLAGKPHLTANLTTDYIARRDGETEARFLLDTDNFMIRKVTCAGCGHLRIERGSGPPQIVIPLAKPLARGGRLHVTFVYEGNLTAMYRSKEEFLELGLDDFWYPLDPAIGEVDFTFAIDVRVVPKGFQLVSNGRVTATKNGWHVVSRQPDFDIDLIAGRHLAIERDRTNGYDLAIVSQALPAGAPKKLLQEMRRVLDFYNRCFERAATAGHPGNRLRSVTGVIRAGVSPPGTGGYFRKGYFVLPRETVAAGALPHVAHELAHHWWLGAGMRDAWLNESFAEYSAMMAIRELRGRAAFQAMIAEKQARVAGVPPIYGFDRTKDRQSSPRVLYDKGPLVLHALEEEIGTPAFLEFLRRTAEARVSDTDALVELLARTTSRTVADDFLRRLKE